MAPPAATPSAASLEAARAELRLVIAELQAAPPDALEGALSRSIAWLEAPEGLGLAWPSVAAVAGGERQRLAYVEIADGARSFADDVAAFVASWAPRLRPDRPDLADRLARVGAERAAELHEFAGVLRCLMNAPDGRVTEAQSAAAEALRFEAAKNLVFALHDDAFERLAR